LFAAWGPTTVPFPQSNRNVEIGVPLESVDVDVTQHNDALIPNRVHCKRLGRRQIQIKWDGYEVCLAIEMGCEPADIGKTIHPHPTLGESIGMAAELFEGVCTDLPPQKKKK
jgi:hypothetical protein